MWPHGLLNVPVGTLNTAILILSSVTVVLAWAELKMRRYRRYWWYMLATITCGVIFLTVAAVLFAPLVHRLLHRFHLEFGEQPESDPSPVPAPEVARRH